MTPNPAPILVAADIDALAPVLRACDVEVPERADGREKDHVERYSIVRLLGTLGWTPGDFPMRLHKSERPDFVLDCDGRSIGIEHTETITENAAKEAFLRSKGHGPDSYFPRRMVLDEPRKSSRQVIMEIEADKMGGGRYGDSVERSWVEAMLHFIRDKSIDANKTGYQRFEHNWLIMYDNWDAPALNREKAVVRLQQALAHESPWSTFERVFNFAPRSFVIAGSLAEFVGEGGVSEDRLRGFELYRSNLQQPEVFTFDELLERARHIVELGEAGAAAHPNVQVESAGND